MLDLAKGHRFELILVGIILVSAAIWAYFNTPQDISPNTVDVGEQKAQPIEATGLKLESSAFANEATIPVKYTCDGQNINPPFTIARVPETAKTLALVVDDPDAPAGTFVHWLVWNINPQTSTIAEEQILEKATQGTTSARKPGYTGPCPPSGTHRYFFKLYVLDREIGLDSKATIKEFEKEAANHIIAQTTLLGRYSR